MRGHVLSILGYFVATFVTQAVSHFVIFAPHYAAIAYLKPEPVFALGLAAMVVQGAILSYLFVRSRFAGGSLIDAVRFAWLLGAFLVSYMALAEVAKYKVPSVATWIAVEVGVGLVQFTLAGLVLGLAHRTADRRGSPLSVG